MGGVCYFNCGPDSGASQPHKHLQIVPLPLSPGCDAVTPFYRLLDESCTSVTSISGGSVVPPVEVKVLPFRSYAARLPPPER